MHHFRSTYRNYHAHRVSDRVHGGCPFCQGENAASKTLIQHETMHVIPNRTKYDVFEGRPVIDHVLVIPKRHLETVGDFNDQEKLDMMTIIGEYEAKGYNVYARGVGSVSRSVQHQHTHLIKLVEKPMRYIVHIKKPYLLING